MPEPRAASDGSWGFPAITGAPETACSWDARLSRASARGDSVGAAGLIALEREALDVAAGQAVVLTPDGLRENTAGCNDVPGTDTTRLLGPVAVDARATSPGSTARAYIQNGAMFQLVADCQCMHPPATTVVILIRKPNSHKSSAS